MKYKQIIQELKESHDPNVQIFLNDAEKIIRLPRKKKKLMLSQLQKPGVIDALVKNYIPTIIRIAYANSLLMHSVSFLDLVGEGVNKKNSLPDFKQEAPMATAAKVDRFKWAKNGQGIRVKMCCASCAHKDLTRAVTKRYCSITGQCVDPLNVCEKWEMSEQMKIAGLLQ